MAGTPQDTTVRHRERRKQTAKSTQNTLKPLQTSTTKQPKTRDAKLTMVLAPKRVTHPPPGTAGRQVNWSANHVQYPLIVLAVYL